MWPLVASSTVGPRSAKSCWWSRWDPGHTQRLPESGADSSERNRCQHGERGGCALLWAVTVEVRSAGAVRIRRGVERRLDVTQRVIEAVGRHQLLGCRQRPRAAQGSVRCGELLGRQEIEVRADLSLGGWCVCDDAVNLGVGVRQPRLGNDSGHDDVAVPGEAPHLVDAQHEVTVEPNGKKRTRVPCP